MDKEGRRNGDVATKGREAGGVRWLRPGDWSLAAKVLVLCLTLCVGLAGALTALGYGLAADALYRQGDKTLTADAQAIGNFVDAWNSQRIRDLESLARLPVTQRYLRAEGP